MTLVNWQQFLTIRKVMVHPKFITDDILNLMKYGIYSFVSYDSFLLLSLKLFCYCKQIIGLFVYTLFFPLSLENSYWYTFPSN